MKPKIEFYNSVDEPVYTVTYNAHSELVDALDIIQTLIKEVSMNLLEEVSYVVWHYADYSEGSLINAG